MKLVDTNVLVYAVDSSSPFHRDASRWLDHSLAGSAPVGFAWLALVGFVRVATSGRLFDDPLTVDEAMDRVDEWLDARSARLLQPGQRHAGLMRDLLRPLGTAGNLTNDAHLAALAIEHKATVVTFDGDFGRFPGVRSESPR